MWGGSGGTDAAGGPGGGPGGGGWWAAGASGAAGAAGGVDGWTEIVMRLTVCSFKKSFVWRIVSAGRARASVAGEAGGGVGGGGGSVGIETRENAEGRGSAWT